LALSELHAFQFLGELFICHQLLFTYLSKLTIVKITLHVLLPQSALLMYRSLEFCIAGAHRGRFLA
jgi:hypothetical protein